MTQFLLALFGLTALWLAMGNSVRERKWAPVVGLLGQPAWLYYAIQSKAWGLLIISIAYTPVYARGAWKQWGSA
jgi:hypothetical protein